MSKRRKKERGPLTPKRRSMFEVDRLDVTGDAFQPPTPPVEVECLHCGQRYMSDKIHLDDVTFLWACPTPGCDGAGYGFDIHPVREGLSRA